MHGFWEGTRSYLKNSIIENFRGACFCQGEQLEGPNFLKFKSDLREYDLCSVISRILYCKRGEIEKHGTIT